MRARSFRPFVDLLDARIVLSDVTGTAGTAVVSTAPAPMPGDDIDPANTVDWNVGGNPPVEPYDPMNPPIDLTIMATTTTSPVS